MMNLERQIFLSASKSQPTERNFIYGVYVNGCLVCSFTDYESAVRFQENGKKGLNLDYLIQRL